MNLQTSGHRLRVAQGPEVNRLSSEKWNLNFGLLGPGSELRVLGNSQKQLLLEAGKFSL